MTPTPISLAKRIAVAQTKFDKAMTIPQPGAESGMFGVRRSRVR
jgi:hypothetical protein